MAPAGPASFVARQEGRDLAEYQTKAGDKLLLGALGDVPAAAMFKEAEDENRIVTWIIRLIGVVAMLFGWYLMLQWVGVVADIVPFLGSIIDAGAGTAAFLLTGMAAPLVIALAWLWYRPLVSLGVLVAGTALTFGLRYLARSRAEVKSASVSATMPSAAPASPA